MKIRVTNQGVVIPKEFFEGIEEVEIRQEQGHLLIIPTDQKGGKTLIASMRGKATAKLSTDEIMQLTRQET